MRGPSSSNCTAVSDVVTESRSGGQVGGAKDLFIAQRAFRKIHPGGLLFQSLVHMHSGLSPLPSLPITELFPLNAQLKPSSWIIPLYFNPTFFAHVCSWIFSTHNFRALISCTLFLPLRFLILLLSLFSFFVSLSLSLRGYVRAYVYFLEHLYSFVAIFPPRRKNV